MKPTLLVLAAGIGSRYGSLKQIDKIGPSGESIIDYSIFDAIRSGFEKVVFVIRQQIENEFKAFFINKFSNQIEIDYVLQEVEFVPPDIQIIPQRQKPWGTGHAVLMAAEKINEPFAVINADDFYSWESLKIVGDYLSALKADDDACYCLVGYKLANTLSEYGAVSRGICEKDSQGYLKSVAERTAIRRTERGIGFQDELENWVSLEENAIVSMNLMGFTPSIFKHLQQSFKDFIEKHKTDLKAEFYLPVVVNEVVHTEAARVKILPTDGKWFGVTYKEDKPIARQKIEALIEQKIYPIDLWK